MRAETIFHSTPPPWFEAVKDLKPGGRRRITDGKLVSYNGRGWHLWDFRDAQSEVYEPAMSLAEKLAVVQARRVVDHEAAKLTALPTIGAMRHVKDWPLDARVWFYKAGIGNDEIATLGAFWSPTMGRVVLPYRTVDGADAWIARDPEWFKGKDTTKYLFPYGAKRGGGAEFLSKWSEPGNGVVITEDALSAYRIMRDTSFAGVAAQGTSLDRDAIVSIAKDNGWVGVWLDPDYYGQLGARKLVQAFANLGVTVRNIISDRDPKLLEPDAIRKALA